MSVFNLNTKVSIMAIYNLSIKHFRFPQLFILFSLFMITNFFSVLTPFTFTSALSFNFPSFGSPEPNISLENANANEDKVIQLTSRKLIIWHHGWATYFRPMHLWDNDTQNLTDFATHFSFVIESLNQYIYADGMAFFLAPNGSKFSWITNMVAIWVSITQSKTQMKILLLQWNLISAAMSNWIRPGGRM